MKITRYKRPEAAFTLVELLVVISIICILAGLSFAGIQGAMLSAKRVQAKNDMAQIANAVQFYNTEYGRWPVASSVTTDTAYGTSSAQNDTIISVLRYKVSTNAAQATLDSINPRQIKFLEPKLVSSAKAGVYNTDGCWYDPWGTQYIVFIDGDYNSDIDVTTKAFSSGINLDSNSKVPVSVGVASVGYYYVKNKVTPQPATIPSAHPYSAQTDLISW